MKIISLIILLLNFVPVFAQQKGESNYFLNSKEIDFEKKRKKTEILDQGKPGVYEIRDSG